MLAVMANHEDGAFDGETAPVDRFDPAGDTAPIVDAEVDLAGDAASMFRAATRS